MREVAAESETEHWKKQEPEAVLARLDKNLRKLKEGEMFTTVWPIIEVHPDLEKVPEKYRKSKELAWEAFKKSVPEIRAHINRMRKDPEMKEKAKWLSSAFRDFLKIGRKGPSRTLLHFNDIPVSDFIAPGYGINTGAWVPNGKESDGLAPGCRHRWWDVHNMDNHVAAFVLTHWVLQYHKLLAKHIPIV
ncbi:MAG TPA: hypothetical protein VGQ00_03065 [Candidatus Norongarragalinales archaeon]|jgi:hypothetical protein|nr:hypothetical protein [Candidatus Norongarragalinales archaeon]